jgi:hypothetical protein
MTIDILQREIDQVCLWVDTNGMCVRHEKCGVWNQCLSVLPQDRDVAGFGRYV